MAYQQGYETLAQSMNGVLTISDGGGTIIQNGIITTNGLQTNNILAEYIDKACSIFSNVYNGVIITLGLYITITDSAIDSNTGALALGTTTASQVQIGSNTIPVRSYYTALSAYDVVNLSYLTTYVATSIASFLGSVNTWTNTNNFSGTITNNNFQSQSGTTMNIGSNLTTGQINVGGAGNTSLIGGSIKCLNNSINVNSGQLLIGNNSNSVKIGSSSIFTQLGTGIIIQNYSIDTPSTGGAQPMIIAPICASSLTLGSSTIPVRTAYPAVSGNDIMNYTATSALTTGLLSNALNDWTGALNKFENQLQTGNIQALAGTTAIGLGTSLLGGGVLAMGSYASTVKAGGYQMVSNGMDMVSTNPSLAMTIGASTATSVSIGSATIPLQTAYNAVSGNDVVNYTTLQAKTAILDNANVFTTYNTFNTSIACSSYQPLTPSGMITIGSAGSQVQTPYDAVSGYDIVNYRTMGGKAVLLSSSNVFSGVYNTFQHYINCVAIQTLAVNDTLLIGTTQNSLGTITIGNATNKNNIGELVIQGDSISASAGSTITIDGGTAVSLNLGTSSTTNTQIGSNSSPFNTIGVGALTTTTTLSGSNWRTNIDSQLSGSTISLGNTSDTTYQANVIIGQTTGNRTVAIGNASNNNYIGGLTVNNNTISGASGVNIGTTSTNSSILGSSTTISSNGFYAHEMCAYGNNCFHDFHSNGTVYNDYDARIICSGGTTTPGQGTLNISGGNIGLYSSVGNIIINGAGNTVLQGGSTIFQSGMSFNKGNLTSPFFHQNGQYTNASFMINSLTFFSVVITFPTAFSGYPIVVACNGSGVSTTCAKLIVSATNISNSQFTLCFYNAGASATTGACYAQWMADGSW